MRKWQTCEFQKVDFFLTFLEKGNIWNKGTILVKIFWWHEILADFCENICENISFFIIFAKKCIRQVIGTNVRTNSKNFLFYKKINSFRANFCEKIKIVAILRKIKCLDDFRQSFLKTETFRANEISQWKKEHFRFSPILSSLLYRYISTDSPVNLGHPQYTHYPSFNVRQLITLVTAAHETASITLWNSTFLNMVDSKGTDKRDETQPRQDKKLKKEIKKIQYKLERLGTVKTGWQGDIKTNIGRQS